MKYLPQTTKCLLTAAVLSAATAVQGAPIGFFVDQGAGLYTYEVTNNDAVNYNAFSLTFTGNFLQGFAPGAVEFSTTTDGLGFGQPDTYFFQIDGANELPVSVNESLTSLEGVYAFGGGAGIAPGETETVAVFSTSDGQVPVAQRAFADAGNGLVAIVPEPSSLALLGLGTLLIARRRRA